MSSGKGEENLICSPVTGMGKGDTPGIAGPAGSEPSSGRGPLDRRWSGSSRRRHSPVPHDRITQVRQMDADLVGPAGLDIHLQQAATPKRSGRARRSRPTDPGDSAWTSFSGPSDGAPPRLDPPAVRLRLPINEGQVGFLHLMARELPGQSPVGLVGFGHDDQPGGILVKAVNDSGDAERRRSPRGPGNGASAH